MRRFQIRLLLSALCLLMIPAFSACEKLEPRGFVDTALPNLTDLQELADTLGEDDVADTADTAEVDAEEDLEVIEDIEVDTGPPIDCAAECAIAAEPIDDCFGAFLSSKETTSPNAVAFRFETLAEATEASNRLIDSVPELTFARQHRVILIEGWSAARSRRAVEAIDGAAEELRVVSTLNGSPVVVMPSVVLRLSDDVDEKTKKTLLAGLENRRPGPMPSTIIADLEQGDPFEYTRTLRRDLRVVYADPVLLRRYELRTDPLVEHQWHLEAEGHDLARPSSDINAAQAWTITRGDPSAIIGVYDDGVDWLHPDLAADLVLPAINGPGESDAALASAISGGCCTHGTAVAGVAAAIGDNDIGVSGVCPDCRVLPLFTDFSLSSEVEIAQNFRALVDQGASVINCSWGPLDGSPVVVDEGVELVVHGILRDGFDYVEIQGRGGLGTVITWAAGNGNEDMGVDGYAAHPTTVAVAAYSDQTRKSWYSDYGVAIDVAAPSNGGLTTGIVSSIPSAGSTYGSFSAGNDGERYTKAFGGTSSASPTTAGLAGLIISANPLLTAAEVRQILRDTARKIDRLNADYDVDGHSIFYGYGAIDAYAAVLAAQGSACDTSRLEVCNGVDDNCDGRVDELCDTLSTCEPCNFDAACNSGICVRTPGDTGEYCLSECDDQGECAAGFVCSADLCVPESGRCAPCNGEEICDGVDDDCDGDIDEGEVCPPDDLGSCHYDAECPEGGQCASNFCRTVCETNADCGGDVCREATGRYGQTDGTRFCDVGAGALCIQFICDSGEKDRDKLKFFECVAEANWDCNAIIVCALPFL